MSELPTGYEFTSDPARIDAVAAHAFLTDSYWSAGIPLETVQRAIDGSVTVAVLHNGLQIAMARVVTDRATFAYLADVYVLQEHRGRGIAKAMVAWLQQRPELQGLRRWLLATSDAQGLYQQLGWQKLAHPEQVLERHFPRVYG